VIVDPLPSEGLPRSAGIVIVGGGVNGLALAYNLASMGLEDVVVLDRRYLGAGSTGRCGGGIRQQWSTPENTRLAQASVKIFEELSGELGYNTFFRQGGYLIVCRKEKERDLLRKTAEMHRSLGVGASFLEPEEIRKVVPNLRIEGVAGAAYCPTDGTAYPYAVVWGYATAARRKGVKIFSGIEVTGIELEGGRVRAVGTSRGRIGTERVANTAGPRARDVAAMVGVELPNRPVRHEILVTEPYRPFLEPMVISLGEGIYFSQSLRGEIVGGIGDPEEPTSQSHDASLRFLERFAHTLLRYAPGLSKIRVIRQWAGGYDVTPDHQPVLGGADGIEGYWHACGFSGHGFMLAPVVSRLLAEQILTGRTSIPIERLHLNRFRGRTIEKDEYVVG
jgi:sarcosine oxidase subunit beta